MSPTPTPHTQNRRAEIVDWCQQVGIPVTQILDRPGALTVTHPSVEGYRLCLKRALKHVGGWDASWNEVVRDNDGAVIYDVDGIATKSDSRIVTLAPPGWVEGQTWDAWAWINQEDHQDQEGRQ